MTGIQLFDIGGSFREGMERGQKRAALRDFFQPAAGGDRNALARLMQVDPQAAQSAQSMASVGRKDSKERIGQLAGVYAQTQDPAVWRGLRQSLADEGFPNEMPWEIASDEDRAGSVKFATAIAQQYGGVGDSPGIREFNALTGGLSAEDQMRARRIKLGLDPRSVGAARKAVTIKLRNGQEVPGEFDPELGYTVYDASQNAMVPLGRNDIAGIREQGGVGGVVPQSQEGDPFASLLAAAPSLRVTSRNRSHEQNQRAGGVPNSFHLTGQAIDIGTPSPHERATINQWAAQNGYEVIDNYQDGHVHLEPRGSAPRAPTGIQSMVGSQTPGEQSYTQETGKTQAQLDSGDAVTRMEAERARQVELAKQQSQNAADKEKAAPKVRMQLQQARMKHENLRRAIGQAVQGANVWTAGTVGTPLASLPGTAAANLRASLQTIEANLGFNELQAMRAASPTGGALGSTTERELDLLASTITSVKQSQSPKQLTDNLRFLSQQYQKVLRQMEMDYEQDYGGGSQSQASQPAPRDGVKRTRISL